MAEESYSAPPTSVTGFVKSVNSKTPDGSGAVTLTAADVGAASTAALATTNANLTTETANRVTGDTTIPADTETASYTLVLADAGEVVEMNVAGANTVTVPPNSSVAFPVGSIVELVQLGAGQTTIAAGVGVTIRSPSGKLKLTGQYSSGMLRKRATDEWMLEGDLSA